MQTLNKLALMTVTTLGASALFASTALAVPTTNPCGNIEITDITDCGFEFDGGCTAQCEPLSFQVACDGQCNVDIDTTCTGGCSATCVTDCEANADWSCTASCETDCEARVVSQCPEGDTECANYCLADCNSNCESQCAAVVEADCNAQCGGCCSGSCETDANFDCSLSCTADLQGGCEIDCEAPEGALFCDGQYLALQDIPACLAWLAENFSIEVEFEVEVSASADVSGCSTSGTGSSNMAPVGALGLVALGAAVARRRRKA